MHAQLSQERAEEFYGEHQGKAFFPRLVEFMTSGPIYALVLGREDAIKANNNYVSGTDSLLEFAPILVLSHLELC